MTSLARYLKANELTDAAFALTVGRERSVITKLRHGKASPSLELAFLIERETAGAVPASSWVNASEAAE